MTLRTHDHGNFPVQIGIFLRLTVFEVRSYEKENADMRTTTAEKCHYVCPKCADRLSRDRAGKGWIRHLSNRSCRYENGMKDSPDG